MDNTNLTCLVVEGCFGDFTLQRQQQQPNKQSLSPKIYVLDFTRRRKMRMAMEMHIEFK